MALTRSLYLLICLKMISASAGFAADSTKPNVEFRLVDDQKGEGLTMQAQTGPKSYRLSATVAVDTDDVESADVRQDADGKTRVGVKLTPSGSEKLAAVTGGNVGKRLAITFNGKVQSAPVIQAKISTGRAVLTHDLSPSESRKVADELNAYVRAKADSKK